MIRILQINMHRSATAHQLLAQFAAEVNADLVLISEQYRNKDPSSWYLDLSGTAAIWVRDDVRLRVLAEGRGDGFVWIRCLGITFFSVYLTPNESIPDFQRRLDALEDAVSSTEGRILVGGDFNARALEWGMPQSDSRGKRILEMAARTGLVILNTGSTPTFRRSGCEGSIPDITFASESLASSVDGWRVLEDFSASDHQYIAFEVFDATCRRAPTRRSPCVWNVAKVNIGRFVEALGAGRAALGGTPGGGGVAADTVVNSVMNLITTACEASMPRRGPRRDKPSMYWWTAEIADLRKECHKLRRLAQRLYANEEACAIKAQYRSAKRRLRSAINKSKARGWQNLVNEVNDDPWGLGYKLVTRKIGALRKPCILSTDQMDRIVRALFPRHPVRVDVNSAESVVDCPLFTMGELEEAVLTMKNRKAPGPDGIPAEVYKLVFRQRPELLLEAFNACLKEGIFPCRWKVARLALISKGKGDPELPSAYRPLCMLDTAGKVLEKLIRGRLAEAIRAAGDLSARQFGFRTGKSTVDAVMEVVDAFNRAGAHSRRSRRIVLLITLDVRNAFNSVRWTDMLGTLENSFHVPSYLLRILRDYLKDRSLFYETLEGQRRMEITSGVAQGSILGPDLWNASYDSLLRLDMPEESRLVGYADDVAALVAGRTVEQAQSRLGILMRRVSGWMTAHGFNLALEKTEVVILTRRRIPTLRPISIGELTIESKPAVKYLGLMLDSKMSFFEQIKAAADRAAAGVAALSRLMANVGGPISTRRRLLMGATQSVLLYGAEVWADALDKEVHRKRLAQVQRRGALRVASAYRTVSEPAVMVIAGVIPVALLAKERKAIYRRKGENLREVVAREERQRTLNEWQLSWQNEPRGKWTARLIDKLDPWLNRKHGEIDYFLTQLLSGHGGFQSYLHRVGKARSPDCVFCNRVADDAEHTFFSCERWDGLRQQLYADTGELSPDNIVREMLKSAGSWNRIAHYVRALLTTKKIELDRQRDRTVRGSLN